nr:immunoglobulin heavy chain junction region [Mus musculus]
TVQDTGTIVSTLTTLTT